MRQPKLKLSANDNSPPRPLRQSPSVQPLRNLGFRKAPPITKSPAKTIDDNKRKLSFLWSIPLLSGFLGAFAIWQNVALSTLAWPSLIAAALLLFCAANASPQTRLRNISSLMLIAAATISLAAILAANGFTLIGVELALLASIFSLIVGWVMSSRPAVMLSTITVTVYLMSLFPELGLLTGLVDDLSRIGIGLIPILLMGQSLLALRLKSHMITALSLVAVIIWVLAVSKNLPLHALAGLCFAMAAAHFCLGRACEMINLFGARLHTFFALIVGLTTAFYIQSLWMNFDSDQAQPIWSANTYWLGAVALSMLLIVVTSLIRFKSSQISLMGIFIITLGVLVLPLATARPDLIENAFYQIPGLNAYPGLGLVIGAVILSSCLFWIVDGLKKGQLTTVLIGTVAIGIEALILFQPDHLNWDFGVIFIMSLICALCIGGLIAGSTSGHTKIDNTRNYA